MLHLEPPSVESEAKVGAGLGNLACAFADPPIDPMARLSLQ